MKIDLFWNKFTHRSKLTRVFFFYESKLLQEHAPRVEHNNQAVEERGRIVYYQMPHNHLPRELVRAMVTESARKLNYFPVFFRVGGGVLLQLIFSY